METSCGIFGNVKSLCLVWGDSFLEVWNQATLRFPWLIPNHTLSHLTLLDLKGVGNYLHPEHTCHLPLFPYHCRPFRGTGVTHIWWWNWWWICLSWGTGFLGDSQFGYVIFDLFFFVNNICHTKITIVERIFWITSNHGDWERHSFSLPFIQADSIELQGAQHTCGAHSLSWSPNLQSK